MGSAAGQQNAQLASDVEGVNAASQVFTAAIAARDISAIDKVWAHEPYATFIGPLSTTIVVGWDGVRKAWEMRLAAWAVGIEKVQLLRKNGDTLSFDAFVTNVFENRDGRWLIVSHQATPIFREPR